MHLSFPIYIHESFVFGALKLTTTSVEDRYLAKIYSTFNLREPTYDAEFQHFLRGKEIVLSTASLPKISGLTTEQMEAMMRLSCLPEFKDLVSKVQADEASILVKHCHCTKFRLDLCWVLAWPPLL